VLSRLLEKNDLTFRACPASGLLVRGPTSNPPRRIPTAHHAPPRPTSQLQVHTIPPAVADATVAWSAVDGERRRWQVWASAPAAVALRKEAHVKRCLHELNHSQNITSRLITNLMTLLQDTVTTESDSSGIINRLAATYLSSIFVVPILPWLMVRRAAWLATALTRLWTGNCQAG
jgi:hypothetical protein